MSPRLSLVLANEPAEIARLVESAEAFTQAHDVPPDAAYAMTLCLDEMAANSIRHAYAGSEGKHVWVQLDIRADGLFARVEDEGPPFDPLAAAAPDLDLPIEDRPIGGLGIHIVRTMMDAVEYARVGDRNVVTMEKRYTAIPD